MRKSAGWVWQSFYLFLLLLLVLHCLIQALLFIFIFYLILSLFDISWMSVTIYLFFSLCHFDCLLNSLFFFGYLYFLNRLDERDHFIILYTDWLIHAFVGIWICLLSAVGWIAGSMWELAKIWTWSRDVWCESSKGPSGFAVYSNIRGGVKVGWVDVNWVFSW